MNVVMQHLAIGTCRSGFTLNGDNPVLGTHAELEFMDAERLQGLGLSEYSAELVYTWLVAGAQGDCHLNDGTYVTLVG